MENNAESPSTVAEGSSEGLYGSGVDCNIGEIDSSGSRLESHVEVDKVYKLLVLRLVLQIQIL